MEKFIKMAALPMLFVFVLLACKKDVKTSTAQDEIAPEVLAKIKDMGLSTVDVAKVDEGYLVEGDIIIRHEDLKKGLQFTPLRLGDEEQYYTGQTVCPLPRTITISIQGGLPARYTTMVDGAIARYNAQGLLINFVRVAAGGNIHVTSITQCPGFLASAGFPANCTPYPTITVNRCYLDTWNINTCITIMAHEIGHCIGFRHTDWMNRAFSGCTPGTETPPGVHIPGTPAAPDAGSWMLACIGNGTNRPFNANDVTALNFLY